MTEDKASGSQMYLGPERTKNLLVSFLHVEVELKKIAALEGGGGGQCQQCINTQGLGTKHFFLCSASFVEVSLVVQ